ncbi:MAG: hypothetical protein JRH18_25320 [Deltaproteobacteria bacterium]|nr:hypothetical protein [Deltaproteobacteria bacterium]
MMIWSLKESAYKQAFYYQSHKDWVDGPVSAEQKEIVKALKIVDAETIELLAVQNMKHTKDYRYA